jgi:hypothetical protein
MADERSGVARAGLFFHETTGTVLAAAAGLAFMMVCMTLPLVGPAGAATEHADRNAAAFGVILSLTLFLSGLSVGSSGGRARSVRDARLLFSGAVLVAGLVFLVAFIAGLLSI